MWRELKLLKEEINSDTRYRKSGTSMKSSDPRKCKGVRFLLFRGIEQDHEHGVPQKYDHRGEVSEWDGY